MTFDTALAQLAGLPRPPDAGASLLSAYGLRNPIVAWLFSQNPEILAWTPAELVRGLEAPRCRGTWDGGYFPEGHPAAPGHYTEYGCGKQKRLRVAEASGRLSRRLVWVCFWHHTPPAPVELLAPRADLVMDEHGGKVKLDDLLEALRQGDALDYQPEPLTGRPVMVRIKKPKVTAPSRRRARMPA